MTSEAHESNIGLVWYDPKLTYNKDSARLKEIMKIPFSGLIKHNEMDTFLSCMKRMVNDKVFLITSGQAASTILPHIHHFECLERVFIFCEDRARYLPLMTTYAKVADISVTYEQLETSLLKNHRLVDKQSTRFVSYDQRRRVLTNLSEQMAEFLW